MGAVESLAAGARALGIELGPTELERFERYRELLEGTAGRVNVTAILDPVEIAVKHFVDSLTVGLAVKPVAGQRWVDVGSGGGLPGLAAAIVWQGLEVTLVEAALRKVRFLEEAVAALGLGERVRVVHGRAEEVGRQAGMREVFDVATARALARLDVVAEYALPLVRPGGRMIAMKGPSGAEEAAAFGECLRMVGGTVERLVEVELPFGAGRRVLVVAQKVAPTPAGYPRRAGVPERKPLGGRSGNSSDELNSEEAGWGGSAGSKGGDRKVRRSEPLEDGRRGGRRP